MEVCEEICGKYFNLNSQLDLKALLRRIHLLNVVHLDIKPSNLMFSKISNKIIFIDYGLSEIIHQNIGKNTMISFRGTPQYCG
jgi:serine/threonine protein kinase